MKKKLVAAILITIFASGITGCGSSQNTMFLAQRPITVLSREDGSGTRSAFTDLFHIVEKGNNGGRTDRTTNEAIVANKTDMLLSNVAGDRYAIGYISFGSLNDSVKPLAIDGASPSIETVSSGAYTIYRPFLIATEQEPSEQTADFIAFIRSDQGQQIIKGNGYVPIESMQTDYIPTGSTGKVVIAGSSSVAPVMEKLAEAYKNRNIEAVIEIQISDSTSGMMALSEGICDIAMSSRALTEQESSSFRATAFANDAIVLVVNLQNPVDNLSREQVRAIFTGETTQWDEIIMQEETAQ